MSDLEEFTKARIKYERALATQAVLKRVVDEELAKASQRVNHWATIAAQHAEGAGYCSACFKPLSEGAHDGPEHVVWAGTPVSASGQPR